MSSSIQFDDFLYGKTCVVGRKRKVNQDTVDILLPDNGNPLPPLIVLADGMGGYQGGETASRLVLEAFADIYCQSHEGIDYEKKIQVITSSELFAEAIRRAFNNESISSLFHIDKG